MNISRIFINKNALPKRIISNVLFYFPLITTQTCATTSRELQPSLLSTSHHLTSRLLNNSAHRHISVQRSVPVWQDERGTLHDLHIANTWLLKLRSHHWYIWPKKKDLRFVNIFPRRAKHVPLKICFVRRLNWISITRHGPVRVMTTSLSSLIT